MKTQKPKHDKVAKVRASLSHLATAHLATAGATLCTTLMVLGMFDGGGTGPKVPPAQGE
jgi:hypothetical protein